MKSYEQFVDGLTEGKLAELSTSTLSSYSKKASDASKHKGLSTKKVDNRYAGVKKASDRLEKKKLGEEQCNCDCGKDPCVECGKSHHNMNESKAMDDHFKTLSNKMQSKVNELLRKDMGYWEAVKKAKALVKEAVDPNEYDREGDMAKTQLQTICRNAEDLIEMMDDDTNLPEWVQSKIVKAEDYITTVRDYLQSEKERMNEAAPVKSKFSDMQIKQAYGILNDKRWKGGNMTSIVNRIEAIAKGLSKHPNVYAAIKRTNEELSPAQKKIDKNKNGKIDGSDLQKLRKEEVEKATGDLKDACWKGYTAVGTKMKNGKKVPNCVPVKEAELSDAEATEKERIVKGMKKSFKDFVKKYGSEKKAKEVMYATATKMAQKAK